MQTKSNVKSGGRTMNHNQTSAALKVRISVKAGGRTLNHNQTAAGVKVQTNVSSHCAQSHFCCGGLWSCRVGFWVGGVRVAQWKSAEGQSIVLRDCPRVRRTASAGTAVSGERCRPAVI